MEQGTPSGESWDPSVILPYTAPPKHIIIPIFEFVYTAIFLFKNAIDYSFYVILTLFKQIIFCFLWYKSVFESYYRYCKIKYVNSNTQPIISLKIYDAHIDVTYYITNPQK